MYVSEWHPIVKYGQSHDWKGCTNLEKGTGVNLAGATLSLARQEISTQDLRL